MTLCPSFIFAHIHTYVYLSFFRPTTNSSVFTSVSEPRAKERWSYLIKLSVAGAEAGAVAGAGARAGAEIRICGSVEPEPKEIFSAPQHCFLRARMNLFCIWTWSKVEQDPFSLKTPLPQWYGSRSTEFISVIFADPDWVNNEIIYQFC